MVDIGYAPAAVEFRTFVLGPIGKVKPEPAAVTESMLGATKSPPGAFTLANAILLLSA